MKPFLVFYCLFVLTSTVLQAQHDGLQWYADAEIARKKGMLPEAIKNYNEALRREPQNYRYLFGKAQVLNKLRKPDEALSLLNKAVRVRGNYAPIYALMAEIYETRKDDPLRASQLYDIAFKNEKDKKLKLDYKFRVINYYIAIKKYEEALRHIKEAKIFALKNPELHYLDAQVSNLLGRYASAEATLMVIMPYLKTLHVSENARFFYELGYAYYKQEKYDQAYEIWKKAYQGEYQRRIDRYRPNYFFKLSSAYAEYYKLDTARLLLNKVLRISPEMPEAYLLQAELTVKEASNDKLLELYQKALELTEPPRARAQIYLQMADEYLRAKKYQHCLEVAQSGIKEVSNMPELYFFEVVSLFHLGKPIQARASLELLIRNTRFTSKKSLYLFMLGLTYQAEGVPRKALELFAQVGEEPFKTAAMEAAFLIQNDPDAY